MIVTSEGESAFRLIRDSFDWKKTFTETIAVYQKAIDSVYDGLAPAYLHEGRNRWFKNGLTKGINHYSVYNGNYYKVYRAFACHDYPQDKWNHCFDDGP